MTRLPGGAGIGTGAVYTSSGDYGSPARADIGNVTVFSGTVTGQSTARSYSGAGIGTGAANVYSIGTIGNLTIVTGNVTGTSAATGTEAARGSARGLLPPVPRA